MNGGGAPGTVSASGGTSIDAGLDDAAARLDRVLARARSGAAVSFDAGADAPERELLQDLASLDADAVSFSTDEERGPGRFERFFDRLMEQIGATLRVETREGDALVAVTRVELDSDLVTAVGPTGAGEAIERHRAALAAALFERRSSTRVVLSTVEAAVKIAIAAGTGNPLLALPAAWKFIRGVMAEWEARKQAA